MPSRSSSGNVSIHEALPAPKRQQRFPARRTSVKAKAAIPMLSKDQSTLTQIEFVSSTSSRNTQDEILDSDSDFEDPRPKKKRRKSTPVTKKEGRSSDDDFEEPLPKKRQRRSKSNAREEESPSDDEFEEPLPKKKRRKSKFDEKEAGQSTLTQFDRAFSARKMHHEFELDEDGFQIWEDSDAEIRDRLEQVESDGPEIPETSQLDRQDNATSTNHEEVENECATKQPNEFRTPRKVHSKEVPSSQTPPSTVESVKTAVKIRDLARSPLKERSDNMQSAPLAPQSSPESQNISMKMLERVRFQTRKIPLNDMVRDAQPTAPTAPAPIHAGAVPVVQGTSRPRVLTRTITIQDSQSEGASLSTVSSKESLDQQGTAPPDPIPQDETPPHASPQDAPPQNAVPPVRTLKRVTTVQDSQFDDEDLLSDPRKLDEVSEVAAFEDVGEAEHVDDVEDQELELIEESQYPHEDSQYDYFDPANSALDRDALRFRWTQTQQQLPGIREEDSDAETDDGDLDRGRADDTTVRMNVPSPNLASEDTRDPPTPDASEKVEALPPIPKRTAELQTQRPDSRDDSAYDSSDHANAQEEVFVPSFPPPSRPLYWPSQLSTVVPTQASVQELPQPIKQETASSSQHESRIHELELLDTPQQRYQLIEPATVPISPYKPIQHFDALSSSPFPLPPWSSPRKAGSELRDRGEGDGSSSPLPGFVGSQLSKLVDYSLPPPPSLGSSRKGTPTSSSV